MASSELPGNAGDHWEEDGAVRELLADREGLAPYERSPFELLDLQLRAVSEQLEQRRTSIPVLGQRASDAGISKPASLQDVAPLLLPHQAYKSYPQSFVDNARWDRMNQWYSTLSALDHEAVDFTGATDVDGWIACMSAAGRGMYTTSGTTGKAGFLPASDRDRARNRDIAAASIRQVFATAGAKMPMFVLGARGGPQKLSDFNEVFVDLLAEPGGDHFLFEQIDPVAMTNRLGAIRTASNNGTVRPEDLADVQRMQLAKRDEFERNMARMADLVVAHIDRPILLKAFWSQMLQFIDLLRQRGVQPGSLAPGSIVFAGGGKKADSLPDDFVQQVEAFFTGVDFVVYYSMSEILHLSYPCSAGRQHLPAAVVPVLLDESGERAIEPVEGVVQGRMGLFELALRDRWGGVISSDWVTADYGRCPCGLPSFSLIEIGRISQGSDDKLTCAGTIDAYVRDIVGA
ncbi:MAG: hypothetical protein AB7H92_12660 [Microbacteriaceae bacterium]